MSNRKIAILILFALLHVAAALLPTPPQRLTAVGAREQDESATAAGASVSQEQPQRVTLLQAALALGHSTVCGVAASALR